MKFLNFSYFFACICILFFASCKNDLSINAPYKEVPTVYAVLNPQETMQMIRVNKIFLGEGNANDMAQVADSINYQAGDLTVTLERTVNGAPSWATPTGTNNSVITFKDSVIQASPGAFNSTQRVYVSFDKLYVTGKYVLKIKNNKTLNVFTASANAIDSIKPSGFTPFCSPYYPLAPGAYLPSNADAYPDYSVQNGLYPYSPKFFPTDAAIYTMKIRLHFYDSLTNNSKVFRYVDYEFGNQYIKDLKTIQNFKLFAFDFRGIDLFTGVGYNLSKMGLDNSNIYGRKMYKMQMFAYASTQEYVDYLQFTAPSLSIAQEKPIYSNFDNRAAMGIFTFRSRHTVYKEMASTFISQFSFNPKTCMYKFYTAALFHQGC